MDNNFDRFLNKDRALTMPNIDEDFNDNWREEVIDYITDRYGKNKVVKKPIVSGLITETKYSSNR
jgi:DNA polymerase III, alpha subunit